MSGVRCQRCEGCWRKCRYADFRGYLPTVVNSRGEGPWGSFDDEGQEQQRNLTRMIEDGEAGGVSRRTILGSLHSAKQSWWETMTVECSYQGHAVPRTTDEALLFALSMTATEFRVRCLGMTYKAARGLRRGLTLKEFFEEY